MRTMPKILSGAMVVSLGGELVVVAKRARHAPSALVLLPDRGEERDLDELLRLVRKEAVEAVLANLDGAEVVDRIDLHGSRHDLATRAIVLAGLLPGAHALDGLHELRAGRRAAA